MSTLNFRKAAALFALLVLALLATVSTEVRAQAPAVDPAATQILKWVTDSKPGQRAAAAFLPDGNGVVSRLWMDEQLCVCAWWAWREDCARRNQGCRLR